MAFDPDLNLMYIGTGNGSPWARNKRSPGGGDNLYLSSIVALEPGHRPVRVALPGDARRQLGLHLDPADHPRRPEDRRQAAQGDPACAEERLLLRHRPHQRRVISAKNFVESNWATGYDGERPADRDARARGDERPREIIPSAFGARTGTRCPSTRDRLVVHVGAGRAAQPGGQQGLEDERQHARRAARRHGLEPRDVRERGAAEEQAVRPADRLGPGAAAGSLAQEQSAVERRDADDAGGASSSRAPPTAASSPTTRRPARSSGKPPTGTGVVAAPRPMSSTASSTSRSRWAGRRVRLLFRATDRKGPGTVYTFALGGKGAPPDVRGVPAGRARVGVKYDPAHVQEGPCSTSATASSATACPGWTAAATLRTWATRRRR